MGALVGIRGQNFIDHLFDSSGTITSGSTPQLILPAQYRRSSLIVENISATNMFIQFGAPTATPTMSNGTVSSIAVNNAGFGYTRPPTVIIVGGFLQNTTSATYTGGGQVSTADFPNPSLQPGLSATYGNNRPAAAHCVMTGTAGSQTISSIVVDDPGSGYIMPPLIYLQNDPTDPFGASIPSATSGILLLANGGSYTANGSVCTTDQISIFCTATSAAYTCKYTI